MPAIDDVQGKLADLQGAVDDATAEHAALAAATDPGTVVNVPAAKRTLGAEHPPFILAGIAILGIIGLTWSGHVVPDVLNTVTLTAIGAGAGIATPTIMNKFGGK